ncbi:3-deoxy-D-arabino-heptulosonate 7-phosphate [Nostoc flagelliforme CCNUN1]|uniref:3-deoxy-D-arabino-heptulosonate 7-phosphate n=1 Tax=Nostoc flagelliforme CCNUN1 TaxID=2038116 RepID=A0A2K8SIW6_9NOSO|nr:3-deoxy-D-arabino-heptulosonate 7-phosphate [Nostoc flagelliforme CCNUN1]
MAMAAIAAGADSLMIEVHPNPAKALSDGPQSLTIEAFEQLMLELAPLEPVKKQLLQFAA